MGSKYWFVTLGKQNGYANIKLETFCFYGSCPVLWMIEQEKSDSFLMNSQEISRGMFDRLKELNEVSDEEKVK